MAKKNVQLKGISIDLYSTTLDVAINERTDGAFNVRITDKTSDGLETERTVTKRAYPAQVGAFLALAVNGRNYKAGLDDLLVDAVHDFLQNLPMNLRPIE